MPLNPLLKLKRFASAPSAPSAPMPNAPTASNEAPKASSTPAQPTPTLPRDEIEKLINPLSLNCKHCGGHHTKVNFIFYTKTPSFEGWYCFECWKHYVMKRSLPGLVPARTTPKRIINATQAD